MKLYCALHNKEINKQMWDKKDCYTCVHLKMMIFEKIIDEKQAKLIPVRSKRGRWLLNWCYVKVNEKINWYLYSRYFKYKKEANKFIEKNKLVGEKIKCREYF